MPEPSVAFRRTACLLLLAVLVAAILGRWYVLGVPRTLPEAPDARLACLSYAPFRLPGESPFEKHTRVDAARIEQDLRLLRARTGCVRTYSVDQGLDAVPAVAARLGMTVLLGAWLGRDRAENDAELARAIALASEHRDTVRALVVGNEVLLRRELPAEAIAGYLARARRESGVPVTYADVWEFWLQNEPLADAVDFMTIHILPYWEDEPVAIEGAIAHVLQVVESMRERFHGKSILVGETGWPSAGRARRDAVPGRVAQAQFLRQFARLATERGIAYNFIEAFDQPWKRRLEGAMGGHWGVLDSWGVPKFPVSGPVVEDPRWRDGFVAAGAGALALAGFALLAGMPRGARAWPLVLLAGAGWGAVLLAQWRYLVLWNRDWIEWSTSGAWTVLAAALGIVGVRRLAERLYGAAPADAPGGWRAWTQRAGTGYERAHGVMRLAMLFGAATMIVLLVFDARYRGFPWPLYAIPAAVSALLALAGERAPADAREERLLARVVWVGAIAVVLLERPSNLHAVGFAALVSLMAACDTLPGYGRASPRRASASAASSTPTADGSKQ